MISSFPFIKRFIVLAALLVANSAMANGVVVSLVPSTGSLDNGGIKVFNNSARGVSVYVDYSYTCSDNTSGTGRKWFPVITPQHSSLSYVNECVKISTTTGQFSVINYSWQLANYEIEHDQKQAAHNARMESIRQSEIQAAERDRQEQRRRRATCYIDEQEHFDIERFKTGIPSQCYDWFPNLKIALREYQARERERRLEGQRRLEENRRAYEQGIEDRRFRREMAEWAEQQREEVREREAARRQAEDERARIERERIEEREREARYSGDPCFAATDMASRPPQKQPYHSTDPRYMAGVDNHYRQITEQWQAAIRSSQEACNRRLRPAQEVAVDRSQELAAQAAQAAQAAEAAQREQARAAALADLERARAQGREVVQQQVEETNAMRGENAELSEMIGSMGR
jgi:hypothetical protein